MNAPVGWPREVPPPGAPEWQRRAAVWLFDLCPGEYRQHEVLRRHPVFLARLATAHVEAAVEVARAGWTTARVALREVLDPAGVDAAMAMYEQEGARLSGLLREVRLVESALSDDASQRRRA